MPKGDEFGLLEEWINGVEGESGCSQTKRRGTRLWGGGDGGGGSVIDKALGREEKGGAASTSGRRVETLP